MTSAPVEPPYEPLPVTVGPAEVQYGPLPKRTGGPHRKWWIAAVVAVGLMVVGAVLPDQTKTSVQPRATIDRVEVDEQAYLATLRSYGVPGGDNEKITLGHAVCTFFQNGGNWDGYVDASDVPGLTPYQRGTIAGAAVGAFCPSQLSKIPGSR